MFKSIKNYIERKFRKKNKVNYKLIDENENRRIFSINGKITTRYKNLEE
jgi:hypothetical protein